MLWNRAYAGIHIDGSQDGRNGKQLGVMEGNAFVIASQAALAKIESGAVGKDLLKLISKRCQGVGTKVKNATVTIRYGTGTLTEGMVDADAAILRNTFARRLDPGGVRTTKPVVVATNRGPMAIPGATLAGAGSSAVVCYNPFVHIGGVSVPGLGNLRAILGVDTPAFVALAHELCHAFHYLSGDQLAPSLSEEAHTVGAGTYVGTRISENAVRREHGIPERGYYFVPGDCNV